ncbi:MAG: glycoside hydrolase family 16 protein [Bacteroidales bacterium]|jgi:beta-glucanase (GH16 family)|nr:glycoside hydrolase family 16 protein [Bacteroidales bacterium]
MIKKSVLFAILAVFMLQCGNQKDNVKMELIWADEFNESGAPDEALWSYELGYIRNKEEQKYTDSPENIRIEDGMCVITCRLEEDSTITSASINTWKKKDIKYGRVEVRAQIPSSLGTWPAIWLLGNARTEVGWPSCGELDIMEHVGYDDQMIHANIHTKAYNHKIETNKGNKIQVENPFDDFHIYSMNWYEDHIDFFLDDSLYFSYENDGQKDVDTWPFAESHYLLINLAFGGSWGGREGVDYSTLPLEFKIDYVRVYGL